MLIPDEEKTVNGVPVKVKLIPDNAVWTDASKAEKAGEGVGEPYKQNEKLSGGTGRIQGVTIHNTDALAGVTDNAEQYTRATWPNQNMGNVRVHYYVDANGAWQNLRLNEMGWHSGDTDDPHGGNRTTVALEIIMSGRPQDATADAAAEDNGARLAAQILFDNGLSWKELYTHTYWINRENGYIFPDREVQNVYINKDVYKVCPQYILPHWGAFVAKVDMYLQELRRGDPPAYRQVGDTVWFKGGYHYPQADADISVGGVRTPGSAIVTHVAEGRKHPYHLVAAMESDSDVYGWVDDYTVGDKRK